MAIFSSGSLAKRLAIASSPGDVQRFFSATRYGSVKIKSSVILHRSTFSQNSCICAFLAPADRNRSEVKNSVLAM